MKATTAFVICLLLGTCSERPTLLEQVQALDVLRVVTHNSPTTYYLGPDGPMGLEYDLSKGFADSLGVRLELTVAARFVDVLPAVAQGRAHLAAASLAITEDRRKRFDFGPIYQHISQQLVYRMGNRKPRDLGAALSGRLEVIAESSFSESLADAREDYPELVWVENPNADVEELLRRVSERSIDYTIADSTEIAISRNFYPEIQPAFDIGEPDSLAWAFKKSLDPSLREAAQNYVQTLRESGRLVKLLERYYGHTDRFDYVSTRTFVDHVESRLPHYRQLFKQAAERNGIDWRLLAAIGYQESHWNPGAVSPTGVRGIMMLTHITAAQMGVIDRRDPTQSIDGGAKYFDRVKAKIPERIGEPDRTWLTLAAYNVGFGHLEDARIITEIRGGDPDQWVQVRESLPLLSQQKWFSRVKRGYARGWEPVLYVDNIRNYFDILIWMTADEGEGETLKVEPDPDVEQDPDADPAPAAVETW